MRVLQFPAASWLGRFFVVISLGAAISVRAQSPASPPPPPSTPPSVAPPPADVNHLQPGAKVVVNWGGNRIGEFTGYAATGWLHIRVLGRVGMVQDLVLPPNKVRVATDADSNLPPPPPPGAATGSSLPAPPPSPPDPNATPALPHRRFDLMKPTDSPHPARHYKMGDKVLVSLTGGLHPSIWKAEGEFVSYDKGGYALVLVRQGRKAETLRVPLNSIRPVKDDDSAPETTPGATPSPGSAPSTVPPAAPPEADGPKKVSA